MCDLTEVFKRSDVVTLHMPWLKETKNMIKKEHFEIMKPYATFINSSRGAIVNENDMLEVMKERQDLTCILDVTYPEPPLADSILYNLKNVILTPHIAGSMGKECRRMGNIMVRELDM